jgi:hypothetical protein
MISCPARHATSNQMEHICFICTHIHAYTIQWCCVVCTTAQCTCALTQTNRKVIYLLYTSVAHSQTLHIPSITGVFRPLLIQHCHSFRSKHKREAQAISSGVAMSQKQLLPGDDYLGADRTAFSYTCTATVVLLVLASCPASLTRGCQDSHSKTRHPQYKAFPPVYTLQGRKHQPTPSNQLRLRRVHIDDQHTPLLTTNQPTNRRFPCWTAAVVILIATPYNTVQTSWGVGPAPVQHQQGCVTL